MTEAARSILTDEGPAWVRKHSDAVGPWMDRLRAMARAASASGDELSTEEEGQWIQAEAEAVLLNHV